MKVSELVKMLKLHTITDHGMDAELTFWDVDNDCELQLMPQSDDDSPGVEIIPYLGCNCEGDIVINLKHKA